MVKARNGLVGLGAIQFDGEVDAAFRTIWAWLQSETGGPVSGYSWPGEPTPRDRRPSEQARTPAFRAADAARKRAARATRKTNKTA
jgi:hypothetical protein